jgi:glycosyltransferase involved in cell wall biosynthesis
MTVHLDSGGTSVHASTEVGAPRLIVINQTVGPAFLDWLPRLAAVSGPIALWSGNAPPVLGPEITVRRFTPYENSSAGRRLITWVKFTLAATWQLLRQGGDAPLFVVSNPPFMALVARWLRVMQDRRYGLLEWDIYPQILIAMGLVTSESLLYRLWYRCHASALRSADLIMTVGDGMAGVLRRMAGSPDLPVAVVPNWADTDFLTPLSREDNPFVREQGIEDKLVVLYSGNLGATHAIETILDVAQLLADESRVCFVIIGEGSKRGLVESAIARGRAPTLRLLPLQPAVRLPQTLSSSHVAIVTLGRGYEGLSMPSKIYSMMAAGNAILGISQPPNDVADTISHHGCGINFRPDEPLAIAGWIRGLLADPAALARLQMQSRQAAISSYSTVHCTALLSTMVIASLLNQHAERID